MNVNDLGGCFFGDCREVMRSLIANSCRAQMCVTSPPYWGLRDYGHTGQLGLEPTPEEYVANLVETFRLVRDLLMPDGTLWLNLGDSYCSAPNTHGANNWRNSTLESKGRGQERVPRPHQSFRRDRKAMGNNPHREVPALKPKDLVGVPWRVAFALQADGWYLRQDIIWNKPNPMPESVRDRCTKAHEYVFLLSKSRKYYCNMAAIAEPVSASFANDARHRTGGSTRNDKGGYAAAGAQNPKGPHRLFGKASATRNKRSVWTVPPKPYAGAHFATFPPDLIKPCILAGSRSGDTVIDPFFGSGTTGQVAQAHGRAWIGIELNRAYEQLQRQRTRRKEPESK